MTGQEMTGPQAEALARFLAALRPGQRAWTVVAVSEALRTAATKTRDVRTITLAALAATLDPKVVTPSVIAMDGRHWERASGSAEQADSRAGAGFYATACRRCGWFHRPGEDCDRPNPPVDLAAAAARAREAIRAPRSSG